MWPAGFPEAAQGDYPVSGSQSQQEHSSNAHDVVYLVHDLLLGPLTCLLVTLLTLLVLLFDLKTLGGFCQSVQERMSVVRAVSLMDNELSPVSLFASCCFVLLPRELE